jgi:ribosomal protein S18 acetylase RimI-like enzyme
MQVNNLNYKLSETIKASHLFDFYFDSIYKTIFQLNKDYPCFHDWYYGKVKRGVITGEREIIFNITGGYIAGIAILKKTWNEKKICTLRVSEKFQRNGIGRSLALESFKYLDTDAPFITVSFSKENQFKRLFNCFGFKKSSEFRNYYSPNKIEITYNDVFR